MLLSLAPYKLGAPVDASSIEAIYAAQLAAATKIIYMSPGGSDTTGAGTKENPYKGITKAVQQATATGTAIILEPGEHNLGELNPIGLGAGGIFDADKAIKFFGKPKETIVNCTSNQRDIHAWSGTNLASAVYSIIFKMFPTATQNSDSYMCSFLAGATGAVAGEVWNCVFHSIGNASMVYANSGAANLKLRHSVFSCTGTAYGNYTGQPNTLNYCAGNKSGFAWANAANKVGNVHPVTFDADWHSSQDDNLAGVYSGTYAWQN